MDNNKKLNILQIVNGLARGGAELKLLELTNKLKRKYPESYNLIICSIGQGGQLKKDFERCGFETHVFSKQNKFDISLIYKVAKLMRIKSIDIVQTTLFYADVIGAISAFLARVPVMISWETVSHSDNYMHGKLHQSYSYQLAMKLADKIVAVSAEVKKSLIEKYNIDESKIIVIHYGVDIDRFKKKINQTKKKELLADDNYPILGVIGRLDPIKGHCYLLEAMVGVVKMFPKAKCLVVGAGPCKEELEQKAHYLGISNNILFLGFRKDIRELLSIFDVFILPSISEGLPNAILEAMACEIPVIATAVGGIPEVISHRITGMLAPPKNSTELSSAILELLSNYKLKETIIKNAKAKIIESFSLEKQVHDFHMLYQNCLKQVK